MNARAFALFLVCSGLSAMTGAAASDKAPQALVYAPNFDGKTGGEEAAAAKAFSDAGYVVTEVPPEGLCGPLPEADVLVLPHAGRLPLESIGPVQHFLETGGDLVALDAPMWRELLVRSGDAWLPVEEFRRQYAAQASRRPLVDWNAEDPGQWMRAFRTDALKGVYSTVAEGPSAGQKALHGEIKKLDGWDSILRKFGESPFAAGEELVVFSARSLGGATHLALEFEERDGSRWIASVALSGEWKEYALTLDDFKFWESVPTRSGTRLNPQNVGRLGITLAFTHTGYADRDLKYEIGPIFAARLDEHARTAFSGYTVPALEVLCPGYKFFQPGDVATLDARGFASGQGCPLPGGVLYAMHPRPQANGFEKGRYWAWEPILEAHSAEKALRGTIGAMISWAGGPSSGGRWVSVGIGDGGWYQSEGGRGILRQIAVRLRNPMTVLDCGADRYAYFSGQPVTLGMTLFQAKPVAGEAQGFLVVKSGNKVVHQERPTLSMNGPQKLSISVPWVPESWPEEGYRVEATVVNGDGVAFTGAHEIHVWRPSKTPQFVEARDGMFVLGGRQWRPHGVNYMPSSGIASEDKTYFEQWLSPQSYDPEVVQRDLDRCAAMGFNALSVFLYRDYTDAQNLVDLLMRMERLGMKANVSLRPGTPMEALPEDACAMIKALHLAENDTVFAYDLAWEPQFRPFERDPFNGAWAAWIEERFGSIENAERLWNFKVPRDASGRLLNFTEAMIGKEGPWGPYVAAYRRFLDTLLYEKYSAARRLVRGVDANHHVSFRMSMASDPTDTQTNTMVYDFAYLAGAVDVLEPEAYGRIGDWDRVKPGRFTREYARWANPAVPMMWAEAGVHVWDMASMSTPAEKLAYQAQFYRDFYRMMTESGADGIFWWWYPGGFRSNENSDYGIINPDGTDRPVTKVIREHAADFVNAPPLRAVTEALEFDRDRFTNGLSGVYGELEGAFWKSADAGGVPGLRTAGTGSTSADCPLTAVGNVEGDGPKPLKYLDAFFDSVEVRFNDGPWTRINRGDEVTCPANAEAIVRVSLTNLGEATLLCAEAAKGRAGAVAVTVTGGMTLDAGLPVSLSKFASTVLEIPLTRGTLSGRQPIEVGMTAAGRSTFGPRFGFTVSVNG